MVVKNRILSQSCSLCVNGYENMRLTSIVFAVASN